MDPPFHGNRAKHNKVSGSEMKKALPMFVLLLLLSATAYAQETVVAKSSSVTFEKLSKAATFMRSLRTPAVEGYLHDCRDEWSATASKSGFVQDLPGKCGGKDAVFSYKINQAIMLCNDVEKIAIELREERAPEKRIPGMEWSVRFDGPRCVGRAIWYGMTDSSP